jgi:hypothetical protein
VALRYRVLLAVATAVPLVLATACSGGGNASSGSASGLSSALSAPVGPIPSTPAPGSQSLSETGSTLLAQLMGTWAAAYHRQYPNVSITTAGTGSGKGISEASGGKADIGASDAYLSSGDLVQNLTLRNIPLAVSAQQVNYNLPFAVARSDLRQGTGHGSTPAETLAQAAIDAQQIRGDELINLISRSGDTTFVKDFTSVRSQLGPWPGTLLTSAAATSSGGAGAQWVAAASRDLQAWYRVNEQAYALDGAAQYAQETRLVTGPGAGNSTAGFDRVETDLSRAIAADLVIFHGSATSGQNAVTGLEAGIIVIAVLMALGCAWGLNIRLAEYQ